MHSSRFTVLSLSALSTLGLLAASHPGTALAAPTPECRIFGEAEAQAELDWRDMEPDLYSYETIRGRNITAATPNACAKAARTILGATVEGRKIVGIRFSYSDVELDYLGRRTSKELKLRMSVYGQRGQSSVIAHGIAESMGTLTGYLCKVSPHNAEGVDKVSVKARY